MEDTSTLFVKEKWYNKNIFPLIPILSIKKSDKYNTSGFTFKWLFFTAWTLDSMQFEISVVASTHWGIGIIGLLPFLRLVATIPCPEKLGIWLDRVTSRSIIQP